MWTLMCKPHICVYHVNLACVPHVNEPLVSVPHVNPFQFLMWTLSYVSYIWIPHVYLNTTCVFEHHMCIWTPLVSCTCEPCICVSYMTMGSYMSCMWIFIFHVCIAYICFSLNLDSASHVALLCNTCTILLFCALVSGILNTCPSFSKCLETAMLKWTVAIALFEMLSCVQMAF